MLYTCQVVFLCMHIHIYMMHTDVSFTYLHVWYVSVNIADKCVHVRIFLSVILWWFVNSVVFVDVTFF